MGSFESQRLRDPLYGLIVFGGETDGDARGIDRIAWNLINTPEFQRLRRIRQLGFSEFVYPGATHSRFAHCVGAYHTARGIMAVIRRRHDGQFDAYRAQVALLGALLHDVGHGPFSHVFETVCRDLGLAKNHEDWGREVIEGDTKVNRVLRCVDPRLPNDLAALLRDDLPKDIYATVVSSQLDADRLDYIQRDRLMTGVQFGHVDRDWLFDCMEVGEVTVEAEADGREAEVTQVPCLYLNHKGIQVGEEYLEARLRMYTMVYMHKTTRAAEMMLGELLRTAQKAGLLGGPLQRFFKSADPSLPLYLDLDDSSIWATVTSLKSSKDERIANLAARILNRDLYKCFDIGRMASDGNLRLQFQSKINDHFGQDNRKFLKDDHAVQLYKAYDFQAQDALKKILVKPEPDSGEPRDIENISEIVQALRAETRNLRLYAPDKTEFSALEKILAEVKR